VETFFSLISTANALERGGEEKRRVSHFLCPSDRSMVREGEGVGFRSFLRDIEAERKKGGGRGRQNCHLPKKDKGSQASSVHRHKRRRGGEEKKRGDNLNKRRQ